MNRSSCGVALVRAVGIGAGLVAILVGVAGCGDTSYPEPNNQDMVSALQNELRKTPLQDKGDGNFTLNNPINGIAISIAGFEKLGCEKASSGPGYICSYRVAHDANLHTNENNVAGAEHAAAANRILKMFMGGGPVWESKTSRFVRSSGQWSVIHE